MVKKTEVTAATAEAPQTVVIEHEPSGAVAKQRMTPPAILPQAQYPATVEGLLSQAIDKGATIETIERLLAVRDKLLAEQAKKAYYADLAKFQGECPVIKKNKTVKNKDKTNRYAYATAEQIENQTAKIRMRHGFSHTFRIKYENEIMSVTCVIQHIGGHTEESLFPVPIDTESYMNNQQRVASARTFACRYAMLSGYGIVTGDSDDDANIFNQDETRRTGGPGQGAPMGKPQRNLSDDEVNNVHEKTLLYLEAKDNVKMKELWGKYGPEDKAHLWRMFNSSQRAAIGKLVEANGRTVSAGDVP